MSKTFAAFSNLVYTIKLSVITIGILQWQILDFEGFMVKDVFHSGRFTRAGKATNFNLVKNLSRGHAGPRKLNVVQLPSVSARTKADRKRSD